MAAKTYVPVYGRVQTIQAMSGQCCNQLLTIRTDKGIVNFVVSPNTYVVNNARLRPGMQIAAFYDSNAPVPLIFPPQYQAEVITSRNPREEVMVGQFNNNLVSSDNTLQLNLAPNTEIVTTNGQNFTCNLGNRTLIVYYSTTTRSIPPQTTPRKIIVMC